MRLNKVAYTCTVLVVQLETFPIVLVGCTSHAVSSRVNIFLGSNGWFSPRGHVATKSHGMSSIMATSYKTPL